MKNLLKNIDSIKSLNALIKCWQTKRQYRSTVGYYSRLQPKSEVRKISRRLDSVPRIFFVGTDEQQDKSGFVQALGRVSDLQCFTREDGSWGQNDPSSYAIRRDKNTRRIWALLNDLDMKGWQADVLLMQTWGCLLDPSVFPRIREKYGTLICNVSMDDRHQYWGRRVQGEWDGVYPLIPHLDLALTAAPEAVAWYQKEACPALYFPEASDPAIFHPMPDLAKTCDVSFVGSRYGIREDIVMALRHAGVEVHAYGSGWESGRISTEQVPVLFAQSRVVLGVSTIGHCPDFVGLKLRDFDAPMSGSCYLTQHNDDLCDLYEIDKEIVTYHNVEDCVNKVKYLLANADEREAIAAAGCLRAMREHTWDKRFELLLNALSGRTHVWN